MAKSKRAKEKYPALKPELNLKTRYELIDYDYIGRLTEEEKQWLNKFTEEYVNASLDSENVENNFHNTQELKRDCYRRNNARNRDILTRAKASGSYVSTDELLLNKKEAKLNASRGLFEKLDGSGCDLEETSGGAYNDRDDSDNF
jgi:hypothetical protein